ncbi:hypothetical protein [Bacteroides acidifaciens]|uniref:hypothetical protein n=1 Tax=Bacteroides acidifaciens TaxID=85831 RepID=UPI0030146163
MQNSFSIFLRLVYHTSLEISSGVFNYRTANRARAISIGTPLSRLRRLYCQQLSTTCPRGTGTGREDDIKKVQLEAHPGR